jgi:hypothetical protein
MMPGTMVKAWDYGLGLAMEFFGVLDLGKVPVASG